MENDEHARLLAEIRDTQRELLALKQQALALQQQAVAQQAEAVARQRGVVRLYKMVLVPAVILLAVILGVLFYLLSRMPW